MDTRTRKKNSLTRKRARLASPEVWGRLQRFVVIQAEPLFLFITQGDKLRLARRVHKQLLEKKSSLTYQFYPVEFIYFKSSYFTSTSHSRG